MFILGGIAAVIYYGCGMARDRRCEPGRLLIFVASAIGMVAGVYVFCEALKSTFLKTPIIVNFQNAVWAGIGGACVAVFTLDLLVTELKAVLRPTIVNPIKPQDESEQSTSLHRQTDF
jgi:uncharacterized membrane protein